MNRTRADHSAAGVPIYPSAALGYRVWKLEGDQLRPLFSTGRWYGGINLATCNAEPHPAPTADCKCGFNAYHQLDDALIEAETWIWRRYGSQQSIENLVVGAIAGAGKIEVHHAGFRCQQAQILGLAPIRDQLRQRLRRHHKALEQIGARYQVPVFAKHQQLLAHAQQLAVNEIDEQLRPAEPETSRRSFWRRLPAWYLHLFKAGAGLGVLLIAALLADTGSGAGDLTSEIIAYMLIAVLMILFIFAISYINGE